MDLLALQVLDRLAVGVEIVLNEGGDRRMPKESHGAQAALAGVHDVAAALSSAPEALQRAFSDGRIPDTRTAYLLARHYAEIPATVTAWLAGDAPLTRASVARAIAGATTNPDPAAAPTGAARRGKRETASPVWNALAVTVGKRAGRMLLTPGDTPTTATIEFADGSRETVAFGNIVLQEWTTL